MSVIDKHDLPPGKSRKHQSHKMNCSFHLIRENIDGVIGPNKPEPEQNLLM